MNLNNMQGMMKQVQKMQQNMMKEQDALHEREFKKTSVSDLITVVATGDKLIQSIEIKEDLMDPEDPDMLQDLLVSTINDVMKEIDETTERVMGQFTRGMNLPF